MMQGGVDMSFDPGDYYDPRYDEYNDDVRNLRAYNVDVGKLKTSVGLMSVDQLFQVALTFVSNNCRCKTSEEFAGMVGDEYSKLVLCKEFLENNM